MHLSVRLSDIMRGSDAFAVIRRQRADIVFLRRAWGPGRPFSSVFQATGASDRAAARVIFVILSIRAPRRRSEEVLM